MTSKTRKPRFDTAIPTLGKATVPSPLAQCRFVQDAPGLDLCLAEDLADSPGGATVSLRCEPAGPRQAIYFDPPKTKCAIVTCGGLCPGVNDVIRAIVMEAHYKYRVSAVLGIRYGLKGFIPRYGYTPVLLTPDKATPIHHFGGTVLGSSRGPENPEEIVDTLDRMNISILFLVGGNGTMRAASAVQAEIERRRLRIAVVGIPKTIDNDISFVSRSFGFDTAVEKAAEAIRCARVESTGAKNGIGIVKVMGRESGFIAAQAAMAAKEANFVLVPEDPFQLHGPHGFLAALEARILARSHAVVVLSEGAGQDLCGPTGRTDASGNLVLCDIGDLLVRETKKFLSGRGIPHTIKFIDPSYIIRSVPANSYDRVYCGFLGRHAVHAGLAGKTGMVVSNLQEHIVHLPLHLVTRPRRRIRIDSNYWQAVLETTGQPPIMRDPADCPV